MNRTPEQLEQLAEYFAYLDRLRESGETNMFGAGLYLVRDKRLSSDTAHEVLALWMRTFKPGVPPLDRARAATAKATAP